MNGIISFPEFSAMKEKCFEAYVICLFTAKKQKQKQSNINQKLSEHSLNLLMQQFLPGVISI